MNNLNEQREDAAYPGEILPDSAYFHVILPGLKGGGRNLTGLREHIEGRGWVIASLSTRAGLKRRVYNLKTHYEKVAQELIDQARGRIIRIYAHSLGGIEVLDLMKVLARHRDLPGKTLEIIFISPPGIGQKGFSGLLEVGKRFSRVIKNLGLYDQKYLLPPEALDAALAQPQRKLFLTEWLPQMVTNNQQREEFINALETIDSKLLLLARSNLAAEQEAIYLQQRHKLLKNLVEKILDGKHITEERHQRYLQQHQELPLCVAPGLTYLFISILFTLKVVFNLYRGIDRKLLASFNYCQRQNINTKLAIVVLGHDDLVVSQDYSNFSRIAALRQIPIYNFLFENEEHSSVAHKWELIDALERLELILETPPG